MNKCRILSLCGGGIRGVIQAKILERLDRDTGLLRTVYGSGSADLSYGFDLAAGTSTGGLIALGLAHNLSPAFMRSIYVDEGKKIFADSLWDDARDLFGLCGADYNIEGLQSVLHNIFGDTLLHQLPRKVLVTAMDLSSPVTADGSSTGRRTWAPAFLTNLSLGAGVGAGAAESISGAASVGDGFCVYPGDNIPVYKAALYTAAAPVFFPAVDGFVDGGVYASNPCIDALSHALGSREFSSGGLDNMVVLSIGTGLSLKHIEGADNDWGVAQWAKPITDMMMDGQSFSADENCRRILGKRFHSVMPLFDEKMDIKMDAVDMIDYMISFAESVNIDDTVKWIREEWF